MEKIDQELLTAASTGDLEGVQAALEQGAELDVKDAAGMTPLTLATRDGQVHVVLYLLDQGAEVTDYTIMVAGMSVHCPLFVLKLLQLAQIRQIKPQTGHNKPADGELLWAAHNGDLDALRAAIEAGADVDAADGQDIAAMRWAARRGHHSVVKALLEAGADINQASSTGWTALIEAVLAGEVGLTAMLIEQGADVNARTFAGASVLYFARDVVQFAPDKERATRIVELLTERGAVYSAPAVDDD